MATKQVAKPATPATPETATPEMVKLAMDMGKAFTLADSAKDQANKAAASLHTMTKGLPADKFDVMFAAGSPMCDGFLAGRFTFKAGNYLKADGKPVAKGSLKVYLAHFRKAVKTGQAYDENSSRTAKKAGKKKGARTAKSGDFSLKVLAKDSKEKAIERLRDFANKLKAVDKFAPIAAFVIDALDECQG
jgi:hypothetical protein